MNKLADEQIAHGNSTDQPATDFYARITPGYIHARHPMQSGRHDLFSHAMELVGERTGKFALVALVNAMLFDIEAAERRAAEADRKAREDCAALCDECAMGFERKVTAESSFEEINSLRSQAWQASIMARAIRATITHGHLPKDRKTMEGRGLPSRDQAQQDLLPQTRCPGMGGRV